METHTFLVKNLIGTFNVVDVTGVNLIVINVTAPDTAIAREQVEIAWTVENQGLHPTNNSWSDVVYFSVNETLDESDISLTSARSSDYDDSLEEGENYTVTQNVFLPNQVGSGYLLFVTDNDNEQAETDETDNTVVRPITITSPDVNLVVSNINAPDNVIAEETVEITWTVENQGLNPTNNSWYDYVYFSIDETVDESDTSLTSVRSSDYDDSLEEGESYTVTQNVSLPNQPGSGYLLFVTDDDNEQAETDETDNTVVRPITITPLDVNLVIANIDAPDSAIAAETVEIAWTVENQGLNATNNTWFDYVYFSVDETFDEFDTYLTSAGSSNYDDSLEEGESYTVTQNVSLPNQVGSGYLVFVTDRFNFQTETDETDNTVVQPITITLPDVNLVVTNIDAPDSSSAGETVEIAWTVENIGSQATYNTWSDYVYFSVDETFDESDTSLTSVRSSDYDDSLEEGESYTVSQNVFLPNQVGSGYLLFVTDDDNEQAETDETDNTVVRPITITSPNVNLVVNDVNVPDTTIAGETVEITWTVQNQGLEATSNTWYDYVYFSVDETVDESDTSLTYAWSSDYDDSLEEGESYTVTQNVSLPNQPGSGYLLFVTDRGNDQAETDETDNTIVRPITITSLDVNLVVTDATAPDTAIAREIVEIAWTVENIGSQATYQNWYDEVFFSVDETWDESDTQMTRIFSGDYDDSLEEGESYTVAQNVFLPNQAVGNGYLLFVTNSDNDQLETDETDNTLARPIIITLPDVNLVVSEVNAPDTAISGETIETTWTVQNQGLEATNNNWYDAVYFSVDETVDVFDTYLITVWSGDYDDSLEEGESYTVTQNIFLPDQAVGNGYLLFVADDSNNQPETDETDNVVAVAINITTLPITGTNDLDYLTGTIGDDTISGLLGADVLSGNGGQDTFVYTSNRDRIDTITDFGLDDRLDLSQIFTNASYGQSDHFTSYVKLVQVGANTEVQINPVGDSSSIFRNLVTLENVIATDLSSTNFIV